MVTDIWNGRKPEVDIPLQMQQSSQIRWQKKMGWSSYGEVPKFSLCSDGVLWFKSKSKWQNGGSAPAPGMIIFSDWDYDGISDHVGIVVKCEGGRVYTIEGNSSDQVRQRNYTVDYSSIMGYGVIN